MTAHGATPDTLMRRGKGPLTTRCGPSLALPRKSLKGHEDAFPRPRLSARNGFGQRTFAGRQGNGRNAPIPAVRQLTPITARFDLKPPFRMRPAIDTVSSMLHPSARGRLTLC